MPVNWGIAQGGNNALAMFGVGAQMGQQIRQRQEEKEYKNALATVFGQQAPTGTPGIGDDVERQRRGELDGDAFGVIAQHNPQLAYRIQTERAERQQQQQGEDILRRAIGGDAQAMDELAVKNLPAWRALSAEQRDAAAQESKIFGNAALDILNRPPEQRGQAIAAYVQQLAPQYPEIAQIMQMPPEQQEMALRSAVAEAQMMDKLHALERPDYMAIPQGGTLVDTRNPAAVQQFGSQNGAPVQVQTPEQAMALPPGTRFIDPNGVERIVPGGAGGNAGGNFRP